MSTVGYPFVVFEMLHVSFKSEQEKGAKQFDRTPFFSSYPLKLLSSDQINAFGYSCNVGPFAQVFSQFGS